MIAIAPPMPGREHVAPVRRDLRDFLHTPHHTRLKIPLTPSRFILMLPRLLLLTLALAGGLIARELPPLPPELADYPLKAAPEPVLRLQKGDRLAICGDSITEQRQYSVILETYLTACLPELEITCRQYGWSGERASGFLERVESDVLRFKPTVATTCYGMNDFRYVPYDEEIAGEFRENLTTLAGLFKSHGSRVVLGSPGIIDSVPHWVKEANGTQKDLNLALARFRNIAIEVSEAEDVGFADVYRPMLIADLRAKEAFGPEFKVAGKDGVHPGWAGHAIMAYAFLKGLGADGDMGSVTYDDSGATATSSGGHEVISAKEGIIRLRSRRLPFSPGQGDRTQDDSLRAGMSLVPFDDELNRFVLKIVSPAAATYTVTWGNSSKRYSAAQVEAGVNLAKDLVDHPLVANFKRVWDAVAAKQEYETRQIKNLVHGPEGQADLDASFALTEKARDRHVKAVAEALQPADHEIRITAVP